MREICMKIIVVVCLSLLVVFMMPKDSVEKEEKPDKKVSNAQDDKIYVSLQTQGEITQIELETYLIGVVASEMPYSFELEAVKAQAVAARTFVSQRGYEVDNTINSQVYKNEGELKEIFDENYEEMKVVVETAITKTKGEVITYQGNVISALFYSSNNGFSNDSQDYFSNEYPYLSSVESTWDLNFEHTTQTTTLTKNEVMDALDVSGLDINNIVKYDNGYINTIDIGSKTFSGREVRELLGLRSSCFTIEVADSVIIETVGYGHGVGMSQYGAQGMALEGYTYDEIIKHYYQGVEIENLNE